MSLDKGLSGLEIGKSNYRFGILQVKNSIDQLQGAILEEVLAYSQSMILLSKFFNNILIKFSEDSFRNLSSWL